MFIASFASTWGPGAWVCVGEMYPLRTRSHSSAIATTGNWMWNFILTFFTPFITQAIGYQYGYLFAGCNFTAVLIVYFFLYESNNLTLEQVEEMYNDPSIRAWNSSSKFFAFAHNRQDLKKNRVNCYQSGNRRSLPTGSMLSMLRRSNKLSLWMYRPRARIANKITTGDHESDIGEDCFTSLLGNIWCMGVERPVVRAVGQEG